MQGCQQTASTKKSIHSLGSFDRSHRVLIMQEGMQLGPVLDVLVPLLQSRSERLSTRYTIRKREKVQMDSKNAKTFLFLMPTKFHSRWKRAPPPFSSFSC